LFFQKDWTQDHLEKRATGTNPEALLNLPLKILNRLSNQKGREGKKVPPASLKRREIIANFLNMKTRSFQLFDLSSLLKTWNRYRPRCNHAGEHHIQYNSVPSPLIHF